MPSRRLSAQLIDQVLPGPEAIDVAADANRDSGIGAGMAGDIGSDADPGTHAGAGNARPLTETDQVIIRTAHVFASDSNAIQTLLMRSGSLAGGAGEDV